MKKALYGLRTSPKRWQEHFDEIMEEMEFKAHPHDRCMYLKKYDDTVIMLCCHVDDLLVVGRKELVEKFFAELEKKIDIAYKEAKGSTT